MRIFWIRVRDLDRRWIYLTLAVALVVSILARWRFVDHPSTLVLPLYERIESLPAGSPILLSLEYTPSTRPELEPMAVAVVRHALLKGHRICFMSLWADGSNLIRRVIEGTIVPEFPERVEGRDYAVLGYKAGGEMLINALGQDLTAMYESDVRGEPLGGLSALAGVRSLGDFALIVSLSAGTPGLKEWILYAGDPLGVPVGGGCSGTGTTQLLPYHPRQLVGLLGGLKGAAEYEAALHRGHPEFEQRTMEATDAMGPLAVGHAVIILFIVLGNLGALLGGRRREGAR
jgi:hypothetical protein